MMDIMGMLSRAGQSIAAAGGVQRDESVASAIFRGRKQQEMAGAMQNLNPADPAGSMAMLMKQGMTPQEAITVMQGIAPKSNVVVGQDAYGNLALIDKLAGTATGVTGQGIMRYEGMPQQQPTSPQQQPTSPQQPALQQPAQAVDPVARLDVAIDQGVQQMASVPPQMQGQIKARLDVLQQRRNELVQQRQKDEQRQYKEQQFKEETTIPGLKIAEGAKPSQNDKKKAQTVYEARQTLGGLVQQYRDLIQEYGSEFVDRDVVAQYNTLKAKIALNAKNLEQLGALQEPDRKILEEMLPDPTSFGSALVGNDTMINIVDDYKAYLNDRLSNTLGTTGYELDNPINEGKTDNIIAENPQTGEKIILRDGQWQPM